jgi:hypothetical protein
MQYQMTIDDPKTFSKPLTVRLVATFVADMEMLENVCNEGERDAVHMVGKASDLIVGPAKAGPALLSQYAGTYELPSYKWKATITVNGEQLVFSLGKGSTALTTLSETSFLLPGGFTISFIKDEKGAVTHFVLRSAEEDMKFSRTEGGKP